MCVVAEVATAFELATTYFQVKKESCTKLKKKKKKKKNRKSNEYKNIVQQKKIKSYVHDNIMLYNWNEEQISNCT